MFLAPFSEPRLVSAEPGLVAGLEPVKPLEFREVDALCIVFPPGAKP